MTDADHHALTALRTQHALHRHDRSAHVRVHRQLAAFLARRGRLLGALGHLALSVVARFA